MSLLEQTHTDCVFILLPFEDVNKKENKLPRINHNITLIFCIKSCFNKRLFYVFHSFSASVLVTFSAFPIFMSESHFFLCTSSVCIDKAVSSAAMLWSLLQWNGSKVMTLVVACSTSYNHASCSVFHYRGECVLFHHNLKKCSLPLVSYILVSGSSTIQTICQNDCCTVQTGNKDARSSE